VKMKDILIRIPPDFKPGEPVFRSMYAGEGYDWGAMQIYIDRVHAMGVMGKGVSIGVVDTGMHKGHPDLDDDVEYRDFTDDRNVMDLSGHSTHVRGTIGMKPNGTGLIGIAPEAKIHVAKCLGGRDGIGTAQYLYDALKWMIRDLKVDWINLSLAFNAPVPKIAELLDEAEEAGIGVVAAAGNYGMDMVSFPGSHPSVIAVGATDQQERLAYFSNRGAFLNDLTVVAPGVGIRSAWIDNDYRNSDGTSMAAPHVTALCALITQRLRELKLEASPANVRLLVEGFAKDLGDPGNDLKYGHGRITTEWFAVDTLEDDLERCKELDCMKHDHGVNKGCLWRLIPHRP